jgi:hypothetical protein
MRLPSETQQWPRQGLTLREAATGSTSRGNVGSGCIVRGGDGLQCRGDGRMRPHACRFACAPHSAARGAGRLESVAANSVGGSGSAGSGSEVQTRPVPGPGPHFGPGPPGLCVFRLHPVASRRQLAFGPFASASNPLSFPIWTIFTRTRTRIRTRPGPGWTRRRVRVRPKTGSRHRCCESTGCDAGGGQTAQRRVEPRANLAPPQQGQRSWSR